MTDWPAQKQPASLADRLTRTLLLSLAAVWLVCIVGVSWFIFQKINENFDSELAESAHRLVDTVVGQYDHAVSAENLSPADTIIVREPVTNTPPLIYQLVDGQGRVVFRSAQAPEQAFNAPRLEGFYDVKKWRIYVAEHPYRELSLQLADPLEQRIDVLANAIFTLVIVMVLVLLVLAVVMRSVARRELSVLKDLQQQISQRNGTDLSPINIGHMSAEPRAVGEDVNLLLQRLSSALDVERNLASNAAHELRTPLTVATLRLQAALESEFPKDDVRAAIAGLNNLSHRTEKLLQLSRAESAAGLSRQVVDLTALATTVASEFWGNAHAMRNLDVIEPVQEDDKTISPVMALADPDTLAIALRNLIENALRYGMGARIEIEVQPPASLIVRDFGPGVAPEHMLTLRHRHIRHAKNCVGYGLGLSIAASIVERLKGEFELQSPPPGHARGFEARIHLMDAPSVHPPHNLPPCEFSEVSSIQAWPRPAR